MAKPRLLPIEEILYWSTVTIVDNEDGTWTACGPDHLVHTIYDEEAGRSFFEVLESHEIYNSGTEYRISSSRERDLT
jgi:hypothetical protein